MKNIIKKILKEEFKDKGEESLYKHFKSYMDKNYDLLFGNKYDEYIGKNVLVYSFKSLDNEGWGDYFDVKLDGKIFNNPTTMQIKERFGLSLNEFEKFVWIYINEHKS